ncbi:hypothetical protein [Ulvibacterium marinum]|uniref:hypothetical protein n=1 Tax=Ulvibacterium marinum TaxID=2419782 RepID=UPI0024941C10|nr:hypothetical protein [Ulvibacterium marinum]
MENSSLKGMILTEVENLISRSCANQKVTDKFEKLHIALLKKYYNAADVSIDYHRKRVKMDIIMDDTSYDPKKVNLYLPTLHANLLFKNLKDFLRSCVDKDSKSLGFYAGLLRTFANKEVMLTPV